MVFNCIWKVIRKYNVEILDNNIRAIEQRK